eukprot:scaffold3853_cov75-Skeletonema_dohrnii-CCMP3373.AAC.1
MTMHFPKQASALLLSLSLLGVSSQDHAATVTVFTTATYSYAQQEQACANKGQRLCTLSELCPSRGAYTSPFNQIFAPGFTVPSGVASADSWVAYEATNRDEDNCSIGGGCDDNSWVQIGTWGGSYAATCNTHCEVASQVGAPQCPAWGNDENNLAYRPNKL